MQRHGAESVDFARTRGWRVTAFGVAALAGLVLAAKPADAGRQRPPTLPGLERSVTVMTDELGVPHVYAKNDHDLVFMQGYLHARDRFFQMDANRRAAAGTLAELTGIDADLEGDASARLLGFRRAAERSLALLEPPEQAMAQAYADGVNAWLHGAASLPPEYAGLEVTHVADWTVLDTLSLAHAADPSQLDLAQINETAALQSYVDALGEEAGTALYFDDLARFAPWLLHASVPDALGAPLVAARLPAHARRARGRVAAGAAAHRLAERARATGLLARQMEASEALPGSNAWGVSGSKSASGRPLVAGDGHNALATPARDYEIHLVDSDPVAGPLNVTGASRPGIPGIIGGQNERVAWESTAAYHDVSDLFRDRLIRGDPSCPTRLCIASDGALHAVEERPQTYRKNVIDGIPDDSVDATATVRVDLAMPEAVDLLVVPFRSFGPFLQVDDPSIVGEGAPAETTGLTLQATPLHAMSSARFVRLVLRARDVFEFGSLVRSSSFLANWVVADGAGHLAFYTTGEIPLRADLEAGTLVGAPPFLVRDGSGPDNWVPDPDRSQGQAVPFAIVPPEEMPHVIDPPAGFVVNSNEDASGFVLDNDLLNQRRPSNPNAIYYLGATPVRGLRNARVTALLREKIDAGEPLSLDDMKRIQGDTVAPHAAILAPHLVSALASARRPDAPPELATFAADARIAEAIGRLSAWDFSTPPGVPEGYDAADEDGVRGPVTETEAAQSVAASIYAVWFTKLLKRFNNTVQLWVGVVPQRPAYALVHLLSEDPFTGIGASGVDFFPTPVGLSATDRRDVMLLTALRDALNSMAGAAYADAFGRSTAQQDYRWGLLHRIVLPHRLGGSYSIPPAAGFADLSSTLHGLARSGSFDTVDASTVGLLGQSGLADGAHQFMSDFGPISRHVRSPVEPTRVVAFSSLSGGSSGDPASPLYASQLGFWLTSDYHAVPVTATEVSAAATRVETFAPAP